jgi:tight adherence protein B
MVAVAAAGLALWLLVPAPARLDREGARSSWRFAAVVLGLVVVPRGLVVPVLVLAAGAWAVRLIWLRRTAARRAEANAARMTEACDLLAAELSAGRPAEAALAETAVAWPLLRPVSDACRLGGDVPAAFRAAAATPGASGLRLLAAAWTVSHRTGAGLGAATRRVAEAVRREQSTRRVVAGELASARATARLMAGLPVVALLTGSGAGADPWSFLLRTPGGWACLAAGLAMGFAGLWWIDLLAREADP